MTRAGIWQGRFQFIHKGHAHVFTEDLLKFDEKFIALVNPNPLIPAHDYERFDADYNPFTYFQRMLMWKVIADDCGAQVNIFPCWHAKKVIAMENEFLPPQNSRSWIIPILQSLAEERKAKDLKSHGENIHEADFLAESTEIAAMSASQIRASIQANNNMYKAYIPESILELTKSMLKGTDDNTYYIVPYIGDTVDVYSLQLAIDKLYESNMQENKAFIVVAIMVKVNNGEKKWISEDPKHTPWWFKEALHDNEDNQWKYYKKMQVINEFMKVNKISNYLITPIFIMNDSFAELEQYCRTFLPDPNISTVKWIVNDTIPSYYRYGFNFYLGNNDFDKLSFSQKSVNISEKTMEFFTTALGKEFFYGNFSAANAIAVKPSLLELAMKV